MKKFLVSAMLIGLSGGLSAPLDAQSPETPGKKSNPLTPAFESYQAAIKSMQTAAQGLKTTALTLQKQYENQLYALNKSKGYDPKIYGRIVAALDSLKDITASIDGLDKSINQFLSDITKDETLINKEFATVQEDLTTLKRDVNTIEKMTPKTPTTFPGRCADKNLASQYKVVEGFIYKATGSPTGWALKTVENGNVIEYPISQNVGLIGTGEHIVTSYTPQGYKESGWYDPATKSIVCLSASTKAGS